VLISHTRQLCKVIFVGDKQKTLNMIHHILKSQSQFTEYFEHVLQVAADHYSVAPTLTMADHPYRSHDMPFPWDNTGFAYLLVSLQTWVQKYMGETDDLHGRMQKHNSRQGTIET